MRARDVLLPKECECIVLNIDEQVHKYPKLTSTQLPKLNECTSTQK